MWWKENENENENERKEKKREKKDEEKKRINVHLWALEVELDDGLDVVHDEVVHLCRQQWEATTDLPFDEWRGIVRQEEDVLRSGFGGLVWSFLF